MRDVTRSLPRELVHHVHRLLNVFGIVNTKTPTQTEREMRLLAPQEYWKDLNRLLVLWGKEVRGKDKKKLLDHLRKR
jgi:endonuclease III